MAHEVRLNCFVVKLRKPRVKTGKDTFTTFDEFELAKEGEKIDFINFFRTYVSSFEDKFYVQQKTGKAISLVENKVKFATERRLIYGVIEGGDTGVGGQIKKVDDASDENFIAITKTDVHSIEYFFLLWLPEKAATGLMIVQGISDKSITDTFKTHFASFAKSQSKSWALTLDRFIPEEVVNELEKNSVINKITISKNEVPLENALKVMNGINIDDAGQVKLEIKISGLNKWSDKLKEVLSSFKQEKTNLFFTETIHKELGLDETSEISVEFEKNGKKASAKMSKNFELAPYIYVEERYITRNIETNLPTQESVESYVINEFLPMIQDIILDK